MVEKINERDLNFLELELATNFRDLSKELRKKGKDFTYLIEKNWQPDEYKTVLEKVQSGDLDIIINAASTLGINEDVIISPQKKIQVDNIDNFYSLVKNELIKYVSLNFSENLKSTHVDDDAFMSLSKMAKVSPRKVIEDYLDEFVSENSISQDPNFYKKLMRDESLDVSVIDNGNKLSSLAKIKLEKIIKSYEVRGNLVDKITELNRNLTKKATQPVKKKHNFLQASKNILKVGLVVLLGYGIVLGYENRTKIIPKCKEIIKNIKNYKYESNGTIIKQMKEEIKELKESSKESIEKGNKKERQISNLESQFSDTKQDLENAIVKINQQGFLLKGIRDFDLQEKESFSKIGFDFDHHKEGKKEWYYFKIDMTKFDVNHIANPKGLVDITKDLHSSGAKLRFNVNFYDPSINSIVGALIKDGKTYLVNTHNGKKMSNFYGFERATFIKRDDGKCQIGLGSGSDESIFLRLGKNLDERVYINKDSGDSYHNIEDLAVAGPLLVRNGRIVFRFDYKISNKGSYIAEEFYREENGKKIDVIRPNLHNRRTAFGLSKDGKIMHVLVSEGNLKDAARVLRNKGAYVAMNCDGGHGAGAQGDAEYFNSMPAIEGQWAGAIDNESHKNQGKRPFDSWRLNNHKAKFVGSYIEITKKK